MYTDVLLSAMVLLEWIMYLCACAWVVAALVFPLQKDSQKTTKDADKVDKHINTMLEWINVALAVVFNDPALGRVGYEPGQRTPGGRIGHVAQTSQYAYVDSGQHDKEGCV